MIHLIQENTAEESITYSFPTTKVLDPSQTFIPDPTWAIPHKSSDFPQIATTKPYFCVYSTDHHVLEGGIWWGEMDDVFYNGFIERGLIIKGYQAEFPWIMKIPTSKSGLTSDEVFLYYHTHYSDPSNAGGTVQETHLITTSGGFGLHECTWTDRGKPLGLEVGEGHTGYLRAWEKADGTYVGIHLLQGGGTVPFTGKQGTSTSSDGLTWTRSVEFDVELNMPANTYFQRHDVDVFKWKDKYYSFLTLVTSSVQSSLALYQMDSDTYLPSAIVENIFTSGFNIHHVFIKDAIAYIYLINTSATADLPVERAFYLVEYPLINIT